VKPQLLTVPKSPQQSFSIRRDVVLYFYDRWHYHPELELVHIEQGSGTQFIGDNIQTFQSGDLLLIGSNLPHYWRCDEKYFQNNTQLYAQATVLHFSEQVLGEPFLNLPENRHILGLLNRAKWGMKLLGSENAEIKELLQNLLDQTGGNPIISLMQILEALAQHPGAIQLSSSFSEQEYDQFDTDRINQIYQYTLSNFQQKISINDISAVASISPNSFCRYFKSRTRKTYAQFLLKIRIEHACKLLREGKTSVAQTCFESGFNNFANFNKYFKIHTGKSPLQYQKGYNLGREKPHSKTSQSK
jgi:AraC-like DNA-binding protein